MDHSSIPTRKKSPRRHEHHLCKDNTFPPHSTELSQPDQLQLIPASPPPPTPDLTCIYPPLSLSLSITTTNTYTTMASSSSSILITLATLLSLTASTLAQTAPGPAPAGPLNLTAILEKGSQYTTLIRLLNITQVGVQLQSQLNNSFTGLTIFAPTDNAFNTLKAGTLNTLSNQAQVELILYHVLPKFYTFLNFQTASNPIQTQGSSKLGSDTINVTSTTNNQMNVSTGVVETQVNNVLYSTFPLAVYSVDKVLLPNSLFGAKPPASAPAPAAPGKTPVGSAAAGGPSADGAGSNAGSGLKAMGIGWSVLVGVLGLVSM